MYKVGRVIDAGIDGSRGLVVKINDFKFPKELALNCPIVPGVYAKTNSLYELININILFDHEIEYIYIFF